MKYEEIKNNIRKKIVESLPVDYDANNLLHLQIVLIRQMRFASGDFMIHDIDYKELSNINCAIDEMIVDISYELLHSDDEYYEIIDWVKKFDIYIEQYESL